LNSLGYVGSQGKRIVFEEKGQVAIEDFDIKQPESDQLLISTVSTLISPGTETAFLMALPNTSGVFPQYPGYSNAGVVVSVGSEVSRFRVGDRVASSAPHASYVLVKEEDVVKIPDELSFDDATFLTLGCIGIQGVRKADIELGDSVVVLGQGLIGQMALQLSKLGGGMPTMAVDIYDNRLDVALRNGADYAFNPSKMDVVKAVRDVTNGGASVVIEATGSPEAISIALKLAGRRGRVVLLGSTRGESTVNFYSDVHRKGVVIIGAHNSIRPRYESVHGYWMVKDDRAVVMNLLNKRLLKVRDFISLKLSFEEAPSAYKMLMQRKESVLGIILDWEIN